LAFRDDPDLKTVEQFYEECKQQGLEFPAAEPENIIKAAISATVNSNNCFQRNKLRISGNN
jgi:hypothetical protein